MKNRWNTAKQVEIWTLQPCGIKSAHDLHMHKKTFARSFKSTISWCYMTPLK